MSKEEPSSPFVVLANLTGVKEENRTIAINLLQILLKRHQYLPTIIKKTSRKAVCILWPTLACLCIIGKNVIQLFVENRLDSNQNCHFKYSMTNVLDFIKRMNMIMLLG
jgi:hypothetical protein